MVLSPREQGDLGELSALAWLTEQGAKVSIPLGHSPDYDVIAEFDGQLARIQVKTTRFHRNGRWCAMIATRGGNQSWSGLVKRFEPSRYDYLFVLAADGRRWFVPSDAIGGTTAVSLGGPKYAEFEVESGRPFAMSAPVASLD